jgi:Protein of unknown function DUF262
MTGSTMESDELVEELDSQGQASGIEAEIDDDELEIIEPFDPEKIDVVTRQPTVDLLLSRIRTDRIDLQPDFQRHAGIWTSEAKSRLIESLLLRIPLPTLYAAENEEEVWAVVDGIQRLTAITEFMAAESIGTQPLRLRHLEYLKACEGMCYTDLPGRLQTRLRESELVVHLIRQGTPEAVKFNIFARINTGGLPLTAQELRHALIPGPARLLLKAWASSYIFQAATGDSIRSDRMADREMILRFVAFRQTAPGDYKAQDFDLFLRHAMKQLNAASEDQISVLESDLNTAMEAAIDIFGDFAFRKRNPKAPKRRLPINKALFEAVAVNLAALPPEDIQLLAGRPEVVEEGFMRLMLDSDFQVAISQGTGDPNKVRRRFEAIRTLFAEVLT